MVIKSISTAQATDLGWNGYGTGELIMAQLYKMTLVENIFNGGN